MDPKRPFTLSVTVNISICVKLYHCFYGNIDIDVEYEIKTHSFHLRFDNIGSIIFKNANTDADAKCEGVFERRAPSSPFESQLDLPIAYSYCCNVNS